MQLLLNADVTKVIYSAFGKAPSRATEDKFTKIQMFLQADLYSVIYQLTLN